jgi:hypothetical protein
MPSNNLGSNTVENLLRIFLEGFESSRVLSKTVDTQIISGKFTPRSGGEVSVKRPHQYNSIRTTGGDISGSNKSDILSGKATAEVQDYITVATEWDNIEEALELDQLDEILKPMAEEANTTLETSLGAYMDYNAGLSYGTVGEPVDAWGDVAGAGALMKSIGVPQMGERYYVMNPFSTVNLADTQSGLASGDNNLVTTAWEDAQISNNFGGLRALTSNALNSFTDTAGLADRVGTLAATPDGTYVTHKDTMIQTLSVAGFTASQVVKAGSVIEVTGRNHLNVSTRLVALDGSATPITWRATVTADATLDGAGAGTLIVASAAIFEADGQYNNVDSALTSGDVVTILGTAGAVVQSNMFYHKQAFGLAMVKLPKLPSLETSTSTSKDGVSARVTKYSDGDTNVAKVRFDILPAFATFNPLFAGKGHGVA